MKRIQKQLTALLAVLLVICAVLTSCANTKPNESNTTGTPETEGHTHPSETTGGHEHCSHTTTTLVGKKDATCAAEGYTGDTVCSACGDVLEKGSTIAKTDHTWNNGVTTKNPTCIETGVLTVTCTGCGETKTSPIPTVAHKDEYHDALDGSHNHTCTTCTMNKNEQHNPVDSGTFHKATCLEGAYTLMTCADCGGTYKVYSDKDEDKATGHQWSAWETVEDATCSATGKKTRSCSCCTATESFTIPVDASAHSFVRTNPTVKATCGESATAEYICEHCHAPKTETLPATGKHSYQTQASTGDGWTRQVCSVCSHEIAKFDASNVTVAEVEAKDIPTDTTLAIETKKASISLPADVVSQLVEDTSKKVSVAADVVEQASKDALLENATNLKEEEKERLKDVDIFDFGITVGDTAVSQFRAAVTVTMPYTLKEGEEPDGILIWYVADDGTLEEVAAVYDAETQTVTFSVEHFSFYAVAYKETQAMLCKRGKHNYEPVGDPVPATCTTHGYTMYECTGCHKRTADNFVEKTEHSYGELHEAHPTCTEGDWSYRVCQNCGEILNVTFVRANGHTPDGVATCTTPSTCTTCHTVITPAKGHSFTEWETVVEPTDVNSGLRRRYCLSCGKVEEVKLAASGNIEQLKFESYEQLLEAVFEKVFNLDNGTIHLDTAQNGYTYVFDITVNRSEDDFLILLEATQSYKTSDGTTEESPFTLLYRNGVVIYSYGEIAFQTDIATLAQLPFDVLLDYAEQTFEYINPMAEAVLGQAKELLKSYSALFGTQLNAILKAAGTEYTVEDLNKVLDSLETVYAYCALKMGYHTNLEMQDGVRVPTQADLHTVLTALMTPTENADGSTTYKWDISELMKAVNALLDWAETNEEKAVSEVLYELVKAELTKADPTLTDWNACVAKLKASFPGTMTVKALADRLFTLLEQKQICTADELYAVINQLVEQISGQEFDVKSILDAYADKTLNEMVCAVTDEEGITLEDLIDALNQQLAQLTLGKISFPAYGGSVSVAELVETAKDVLSQLKLTADVSVTLDKQGKLAGAAINSKILFGDSDDEEGTEFSHLVFRVTQDENAKVELPEAWKPLTDQTVSSSFDANGNLVVGGLNSDMDYSFTVDGSFHASVKDLLTKDEEASTSFGFPVYTLPKYLWNGSSEVQEVAVIDGKYYLLESYYQSSSYTVNGTVSLGDILSGTDKLLPGEDSVPAGMKYLSEQDGYTPVYETVFGAMWQQNGQWWYSNDFNAYETSFEGEEIIVYDIYSEANEYRSYDALVLYSMDEGDYGDIVVDGKKQPVKLIRLADTNAPDETVLRVYGYAENGSIRILNRHFNSSISGYTIGEQIAQLKDYDYSNEYERTVTLFDKDGNRERVTLSMLETYQKLPTFYAKIDSDTYAVVGYLKSLTDAQLGEYEQITLADGKTLYRLPKDFSGYVAGYVKTESGKYVQTIVQTDEMGELTDSIVYRGGISGLRRIYFDDMFDTAQYVTANNDGTFTVSAQLLKLLGEKCTSEGDGYALLLTGKLTSGEKTFRIKQTLMSYLKPETLTFGSSSSSVDRWYEWSYIFSSSGSSESERYTVTLNEDGSLTIVMNDGSKITDVDYYAYGGSIALDGFLVYNEDMSEQAGVDIYGNLFRVSDSSKYTVLIDGKYYDYSSFKEWSGTELESLTDVFAATWTLESAYLRYWTTVDEQPLPVYQLEIKLSQFDQLNYFNCFATVQDGQLCILKQAQELGEGILQYESIVPMSDYLASLKVVAEDEISSYGTRAVINGAEGKLHYLNCSLYETDEDGEPLGEPVLKYYTILVFVDNQTEQAHLLGQATHIGSHLQVGEEYTPEGIIESSNSWTNEYRNGSYTVVSMNFAQYQYLSFIRVAGQLYRYDYYQYNSYYPDSFLSRYAEKQWVYAQVGADEEFDVKGDWTAYDYDGNEVEKPESWLNVSVNLIGTDENGTKIYEVSGYTISCTELEDGTVLYGEPGEQFVQGPDGRFVQVYTETDNEGVEHIVCTLPGSVIDGYYLSSYHLLEKYLTVTDDGQLIVDAAAAELLEPISEFWFNVETSNGNRCSIDDIREYFAN